MYTFNDEFDTDELLNTEVVTDKAMDALFGMCIEPMRAKLDEEELQLLSVIGLTLKLVAHKAKLYEDLQKGECTDTDNDFSRN